MASNETQTSRLIKILISMLIPICILFIPPESLGQMLHLNGTMTIMHQRMFAIFVLVVLLWVQSKLIPAYITSMLIMGLFLIMMSDAGLKIFTDGIDKKTLLSSKMIYAFLGDKIIILFLASFFIARSFEKFGIDVMIAKFIANVFKGDAPMTMLASVMVIGILSMFLPNTAVTMIFVSALMPLIRSFKPDDTGRVGFILSVPFAANIGGRGTIIGSPPNAIAVGLLPADHTISFMEWAEFSVPFTLLLLFFLWLLLMVLYPFKEKKFQLAEEEKTEDVKAGGSNFHKQVAYWVFGVYMVLLFITDFIGLDSYSVSWIAIIVYFITGTMNKSDLYNIEWDLIFFMAGAIALGGLMKTTGLADLIIKSLPFAHSSPWVAIIAISIVSYFMGTFMSYSASTALLVPLMFPLADIIPGFTEVGGMKTLAITIAYSATSAMALPVTTPPNMIAWNKGILKNQMQMVIPGVGIGIISLAMSWGMIYLLTSTGWLKY